MRETSKSAKFRPTNKIDITLAARHTHSHFEVQGETANTIRSFSFSQNGHFDLGFARIGESLNVFPQGLSAQSRNVRLEPWLGVSAARYWKKIRLGCEIGIEDALHGRSYRKSTMASSAFIQESMIRRPGRMVYISLHWSIGKFLQTETVAHSSYDLD